MSTGDIRELDGVLTQIIAAMEPQAAAVYISDARIVVIPSKVAPENSAMAMFLISITHPSNEDLWQELHKRFELGPLKKEMQ